MFAQPMISIGVYTICTAYGAYALQQFLGKEYIYYYPITVGLAHTPCCRMFEILLTDDPAVWPWHAFFNLPLIPFSLILSRNPFPTAMMPLFPILLAWPTSTPVPSRERLFLDRWRGSPPSTSSIGIHAWTNWPPSPAFVGLLALPLVRTYYRSYFKRFTHWVLNTASDESTPCPGGLGSL